MSGDSLKSSSIEITINEKPDDMEHATEPTENEEGSLPGVSGKPTMYPRVGHQYQAIIPDFTEGNECSQPNAKKVNEGISLTDGLPVLPIPLMWAPNKARDEESLSGHADPYEEENQVILNTENCRMIFEQAEDVTDNKVKASELKHEADGMGLMSQDMNSRQGTQKKVDNKVKNLYPLPGTSDEPWNDFERESFLLALYIFGKDLYLVKKFIETKKTEDVISFYYGSFYKCKEYQRWAKCLRSPSRKSIHGQRIFTGGRLLELFSRLNRHISEEMLNRLVEMSKAFKDERISFEEYVFTFKDLIGTKLLMEAVAVGKGKQDLTGISTLPPKQKQTLSVRRETQQDKGLSSMSCKEITEQLKSSRLSKNKSNDLFWEAVWPRLLAGGWHSEQPKDRGVSTLKHHLVFLMPGVKKFKRSKHVKGQHYFDSVSDVLNKVASNPWLLELEDEKQENHSDGHESGNGYGNSCDSNPQNHEMEIMIVDTSKHRGSNGSKIRWLESLPIHPTDISTSSCSGTGSDTSSEKSDAEIDRVSVMITSSKKHRPWGKDNSGISKYLSPLQRHRVTSNACKDSSEVPKWKEHKGLILCFPNPYKVKENKQSPNGSKVRESFKEIEVPLEREDQDEQSLPHVTIDLNIPEVSENVAVPANHAVICTSSVTDNTSLMASSSNTSSPREATQTTQQVSESITENKQPSWQRQQQLLELQEAGNIGGGRRQSTRNRPLTTKALEAFESSFFETSKKRKATNDSTVSKPPRPRQRRRQCGNSKSNSKSESGIGSNEMPSIRIEDEHTTGNSGNIGALLLPPAQEVNIQLQLQ